MPSTVPPVSPLRGLLEVTRRLRAQEDLPTVLAAIARAISESLGYETVAINLYRPEWDDFQVTTVHGDVVAREALLERVRSGADWDKLLVPEHLRRGAYVITAGTFDWSQLETSYTPEVEAGDGPDAWHPEDALFVPLRHQDGHLLGIVSADQPVNRRRPTDTVLDVLVALADHAALAVETSRESAEAARHRHALEELLAVSSRLASEPSANEILRHVCKGIRDALGFQNVCAALLEPETGRLVPQAAVGWSLTDPPLTRPVYLEGVEPLLDRRFRREGCYLLTNEEATSRVAPETAIYASQLNGRGPWAWNEHWLLAPLRDLDGSLMGLIWVDDPEDRLLPSSDRLRVLRIFAYDAAVAIVSGRNLGELRFLADHDPLTRLLNRRAFMQRLDGEVARATRYGRTFGLVLADLDGFKTLNDRHGHAAGDEALMEFATVLSSALRKPDEAFRIGGDEFALLLAEADEEDARKVVLRAQRLLAAVDDQQFVGITASFGCASCPEHASDAQALFRIADEALYEAKRTGSGLEFAV
jgi:diguanylate cyclase (GGDEF)-like protein